VQVQAVQVQAVQVQRCRRSGDLCAPDSGDGSGICKNSSMLRVDSSDDRRADSHSLTCWHTTVVGSRIQVDGDSIRSDFHESWSEVDDPMTAFPDLTVEVNVSISDRARTHDGLVFFTSRLDDALLDQWLHGIPPHRVRVRIFAEPERSRVRL
jgi:hypothetical protein